MKTQKTMAFLFSGLLALSFSVFATTPPHCPPVLHNLSGTVNNGSHATASSTGVGEALSTNTATADLKVTQGVSIPVIDGGVAPVMNLTVDTAASGASLTTSSGAGKSLGVTHVNVTGASGSVIKPTVDGVGGLKMTGATTGHTSISTKAVDAQDSNAAAASESTLAATGTVSLVDGVKTIQAGDIKTTIAQVQTSGSGLQKANAGAGSLFSGKILK